MPFASSLPRLALLTTLALLASACSGDGPGHRNDGANACGARPARHCCCDFDLEETPICGSNEQWTCANSNYHYYEGALCDAMNGPCWGFVGDSGQTSEDAGTDAN